MQSGVEDAEIAIGVSTDPRLARGMKGRPGRRATGPDSKALPNYIDIGKGLHRGGPAFLGPVYGPFQVGGDPSKPGFVVQNLQSVGTNARLLDRQRMLKQLDRLGFELPNEMAGFEQMQA